MVLAKKKLKLKLRSLLESHNEAFKSSSGDENVDQQLQNLKELLISKNRRDNRPTRRGGKVEKKKRKNKQELPDNPENGEEPRKRKRDAVEPIVKNKKKKNKKKKNKRKKMKKNGKNTEPAVTVETRDGGDENSGKKVYVGGIPYYSTEDDIRSFFQDCGTVTGLDCMIFPETGKFRGIAIVSFKTEAAAKRALAMDGTDMGGLFLKIKPYAAKSNLEPAKTSFSPEIVVGYNRIYVGNLAWEITEEELRKFFSSGCKIAAVRFGEDKTTGEFKGYAHVDFHDVTSMEAALKLDQAELCGRPARISPAVPRKGGTIAVENNHKKKKRQTCYECGVPGHLSSECPQKKVHQDS